MGSSVLLLLLDIDWVSLDFSARMLMESYPEIGDSGINDVPLNGLRRMSSISEGTMATSPSAGCPLVPALLSAQALTIGAYSTQVQLFYELFQAADQGAKPLFHRVWMSSNAMPVDQMISIANVRLPLKPLKKVKVNEI